MLVGWGPCARIIQWAPCTLFYLCVLCNVTVCWVPHMTTHPCVTICVILLCVGYLVYRSTHPCVTGHRQWGSGYVGGSSHKLATLIDDNDHRPDGADQDDCIGDPKWCWSCRLWRQYFTSAATTTTCSDDGNVDGRVVLNGGCTSASSWRKCSTWTQTFSRRAVMINLMLILVSIKIKTMLLLHQL